MKNRKIIIFNLALAFLSMLFIPPLLSAQGLVNNGASIVVKQDAGVVINGENGNYNNKTSGETDGQIFLDGKISLRGSWYNNSDNTVFANPDETGLVVFGESPEKAIQELGGTGVSTFENLTLSEGTMSKIVADAEIRVMYNLILEGNLEVNGDLYIEGSFTNNGTITGTGTVYYQSTEPQQVAPGSYPNLVLDNPGGLILEDSVFVQTELALSQGSLVLGEHNLVLGPNCVVTQSKAPATWVDATSTGMVIKMFNKTGTFEFPVGNFGTTPAYTPVTVDVLSANFDEGQISVRLKPEAHPDNNTGVDFPNYLKRFWVLESSGLSNFSYNAKFYYDSLDVVGEESEIEGAKFIDSLGLWKHFSHVNGDEHYFEALGLNSFSVFSGVQENRAPTVAISYPTEGQSVCDTSIIVTGTAADIDGDLRKVFVRVNQGDWHPATGSENWSIDLSLPLGQQKIIAKAIDFQGLESDLGEVTVIVGVQKIELSYGWSLISSYLDPTDPDIVNLWADVVSEENLRLMISMDGIYAPAPFNINTLTNWDVLKGYKVKMNATDTLVIEGYALPENEANFDAGANIIPVLTNQPTPLLDVFDNPQNDIKYILDLTTTQIYWPGGDIYTLTDLNPGKGYLANFNNPVTLTYPEHTPGTKSANQGLSPSEGPWACTRTVNFHLISLTSEAINDLENADFLGAFDSEGNCVGYTPSGKTSGNILLTVYGNDETSSKKDGFLEGEFLHFRSFSMADNSETELRGTFSESFTSHDGLFITDGLSAVVSFKEGETGIGESMMVSSVQVYPNPASDELNIVFDNFKSDNEIQIELVNSGGSMVLKSNILQKHSKLDLANLQPGVYVLKIIQGGETSYKKVVVQ